MIEDSEASNIKRQYHNLESMQNIVKRPENCFISPFHNEADHQTRNISTITGPQSDFKETAHLGHERPNREVVKQLSKAKQIRGLEILQKRLNKFVGATIRTTPSRLSKSASKSASRLSKSASKSASKSRSKERSKSQKSKYSMYKPHLSGSRTVSRMSLERSINVSA